MLGAPPPASARAVRCPIVERLRQAPRGGRNIYFSCETDQDPLHEHPAGSLCNSCRVRRWRKTRRDAALARATGERDAAALQVLAEPERPPAAPPVAATVLREIGVKTGKVTVKSNAAAACVTRESLAKWYEKLRAVLEEHEILVNGELAEPERLWCTDETDCPEDCAAHLRALGSRRKRGDPTSCGKASTCGGGDSMSHMSVVSFVAASGARAPGGLIFTGERWHDDLEKGWDDDMGPRPVVEVTSSGGVRGDGMVKFVRIFMEGWVEPMRTVGQPFHVPLEKKVVLLLDTGGGRPGIQHARPHLTYELWKVAQDRGGARAGASRGQAGPGGGALLRRFAASRKGYDFLQHARAGVRSPVATSGS